MIKERQKEVNPTLLSFLPLKPDNNRIVEKK